MDERVSNGHLGQFQSPKDSLGDLGADVAGAVIASATDLALILDGEGVIRDLAIGSEEMSEENYAAWIGRPWVDTVTNDSRAKVEALLKEAGGTSPSRWRQVNHPSERGADVPVRYTTVGVGGADRFLALGRDLRATATLQQRLIEAQVAMERDFARFRKAETRYRLLFEIASEAVLIVSVGDKKVVEANAAAGELLGSAAADLVGETFGALFVQRSVARLEALLARALARGRAEGVKLRLKGARQDVFVSASVFRQERTAHFLVQLNSGRKASAERAERGAGPLASVLENLPDAFVVADPDMAIMTANDAFLDLAQIATVEQAVGRSLGDFIGRTGVELGVLAANLREHNSVRRFATVMRGAYGSSEEVEISAVVAPFQDKTCFGFSIRTLASRPASDAQPARDLPRSVEQLTELVGRVSLKEIVRETTDLIERLCIEAALDLTSDNRASAAEILGLSRQSLYAKLHRHGLGNLASESEH